MKIHFGFILLIILLLACNRKTDERPIVKKDFVNLLIDLHMFDAIATDYSLNSEMRELDSAMLYSSLLLKYKTNKEEFETTMRWYTAHPDELLDVYDAIYASLEEQNVVLNKQDDLFNDNSNLEIWADNKYKFIKGDTVLYPEPYVIEISDTGLYLFDIKVRLLLEDMSEAPIMRIYFIKDEVDTLSEERMEVTNIPLSKSNFTRDFQFLHNMMDSTYKFVKIIIPDTPDREAKKEKSLQISKIRVLKRDFGTDKSMKAEESAIEQTDKENIEAIKN